MLASTLTFSQWNVINSGTTNSLYSVHFPSINIGYAVGFEKILKTTNEGLTWTTDSTLSGKTLRSVFFVNDTLGYTVGNNGLILYTNNGGITWINQTIGTTYNLNAVFFLNSNNGFAVDDSGTVFSTIDGGNNWTIPSGIGIKLNSLCFSNSSNGFSVGDYGVIFESTTGGASWMYYPTGVTQSLRSVNFANSSNGFIVGDAGVMFKTTNGGSNWVQCFGIGNINLNSVGFYPATSYGYIVGDGGNIFYSNNGGSSWTVDQSCTTNNLKSICFNNNNTAFAVGNNGTIIKKSYCTPDWFKYAYNDTTTTIKNTAIIIHVLNNDNLIAPLYMYNYIANPQTCDYPYAYGPLQSENGGTLNILNNDSILYTPPTGFTGFDNFIYAICDSGSAYETDTARVIVHVVPFLDLNQLNGGVNDTIFVSSFPATIDAGSGWQTYLWSNGSSTQTTQVSSNGWYSVTVTIGNKYQSIDSIYVILSTQINLLKQEKIKIFPNPIINELVVEIENKANIEIVDLFGQKIYSKVLINGSNLIDVSQLTNGIYILKILTTNGITSKYLIKQ